jgi:hypothetical protein
MTLLSKLAVYLALLIGLALPAIAADGLVTVPSSVNAKLTIDKLEAALKGGGATILHCAQQNC